MRTKKNKKKEKITYIDDGSTIADMSSTAKPGVFLGGKGDSFGSRPGRRATLREQWQTYWAAVKMMFLPMIVVMLIISVAFLVMFFFYKS